MTRMNALFNCQNPYQGNYKRVLTVCSAGLLRSPTIAWVLADKFNCRAAGLYDYALVQVDDVLIKWADLIICAEQEIEDVLRSKFENQLEHRQIVNLGVPDNFAYRDPELVEIIKQKLVEKEIVNPES